MLSRMQSSCSSKFSAATTFIYYPMKKSQWTWTFRLPYQHLPACPNQPPRSYAIQHDAVLSSTSSKNTAPQNNATTGLLWSLTVLPSHELRAQALHITILGMSLFILWNPSYAFQYNTYDPKCFFPATWNTTLSKVIFYIVSHPKIKSYLTAEFHNLSREYQTSNDYLTA